MKGGGSMAREKEHYRDVLAHLLELFCGKIVLRIGEVCKQFKITARMARSRFSFDKGGYINIYQLARDLLKEQ